MVGAARNGGQKVHGPECQRSLSKCLMPQLLGPGNGNGMECGAQHRHTLLSEANVSFSFAKSTQLTV